MSEAQSRRGKVAGEGVVIPAKQEPKKEEPKS